MSLGCYPAPILTSFLPCRLGDRHGENILFDSTTGECVHVDFNCLFWRGLTFEKPEKVRGWVCPGGCGEVLCALILSAAHTGAVPSDAEHDGRAGSD